MGSIYFHEPLYHSHALSGYDISYNINYYIKDKYKILYNKNIGFTKDNLDVIKECNKI